MKNLKKLLSKLKGKRQHDFSLWKFPPGIEPLRRAETQLLSINLADPILEYYRLREPVNIVDVLRDLTC